MSIDIEDLGCCMFEELAFGCETQTGYKYSEIH